MILIFQIVIFETVTLCNCYSLSAILNERHVVCHNSYKGNWYLKIISLSLDYVTAIVSS
jgi:hypothetical protein